MADKKTDDHYAWVTGVVEKYLDEYFDDRPQLKRPEHHGLRGYKIQAELKPVLESLTCDHG